MKRIKLITKDPTIEAYSLVDDDIYKLYGHLRWRLAFNGYAFYHEKGFPKSMHRKIMATPEGMYTDHINHDKLDNRRENLRICTPKENQANRLMNKNNVSGHPGISKFRHKWRLTIQGKYAGVFDDIESAVAAKEALVTNE